MTSTNHTNLYVLSLKLWFLQACAENNFFTCGYKKIIIRINTKTMKHKEKNILLFSKFSLFKKSKFDYANKIESVCTPS